MESLPLVVHSILSLILTQLLGPSHCFLLLHFSSLMTLVTKCSSFSLLITWSNRLTDFYTFCLQVTLLCLLVLTPFLFYFFANHEIHSILLRKLVLLHQFSGWQTFTHSVYKWPCCVFLSLHRFYFISLPNMRFIAYSSENSFSFINFLL